MIYPALGHAYFAKKRVNGLVDVRRSRAEVGQDFARRLNAVGFIGKILRQNTFTIF